MSLLVFLGAFIVLLALFSSTSSFGHAILPALFFAGGITIAINLDWKRQRLNKNVYCQVCGQLRGGTEFNRPDGDCPKCGSNRTGTKDPLAE